MEGDNKVANLVKIDRTKKLLYHCPGGTVHAYQVYAEEKITEVRVQVGKFGFIKSTQIFATVSLEM